MRPKTLIEICRRGRLAALLSMTATVGVSGGCNPSERVKDALYPSKPIRLVVGFGAGGGTDLIARAVSAEMEQELGQPILVINKPGAAGALAAQEVARAKPDGYTLLIAGGSETTSVGHFLELTYDPMESFAPVARMTSTGMLIIVRADSAWKTLEEFVDSARKSPGQLKYSSSGHGSLYHSTMLSLANKAKISLVHVPYDGGASSLAALMGGHVDVAVAMPAEADALLTGGAVRALAVTSPEPTPLAPNVPTLTQLGYDLGLVNQKGIVAPNGTPTDRIAVLQHAAELACADAEFQAAAEQQRMQVAFLDAEDFRQSLSDMYVTLGHLLPVGEGN